jgi:hypothetical protein
LTKLEDSVEDHKSRFLESLLSADGSGETASADVIDYKFPQNNGRIDENKSSTIDSHQSFAQSRLFHLSISIWIWNLSSFSFLFIFCDVFFFLKSAWPFLKQNVS